MDDNERTARAATTGLVLGAFDVFHVGHLRALQAASERCVDLVVMVADDEMVTEVTGVAPVVGGAERAEVVVGFGLAVDVLLVSSDDLDAVIAGVAATVLFVTESIDGTDASVASMEVVTLEVSTTEAVTLTQIASAGLLWPLPLSLPEEIAS